MKEVFNNTLKQEELPTEEQLIVPVDISKCDKAKKARAISLMNTLAKNSKTGKKLLEGMVENGYNLVMQPNFAMFGCCCDSYSQVMLSSVQDDDLLITTLAHEARHVKQISMGYPCDLGEFDIKTGVMLDRAKEADAYVAATVIAYELAENGITNPMEVLKEKAPEVVLPFLKAQKDPALGVTDEMKQAAFEGWYSQKERVDAYETNSVSWTLDNSWDSRNNREAYFQKSLTSKQIAETVCADEKGHSYLAGSPDLLNEPEKIAILASTVKKCEQANKIRSVAGLSEETSYKTIPTREGLAESASQKKQTDKTVSPAIMAQALKQRLAR